MIGMGIKQPGLYVVFGNKKKLFNQALERNRSECWVFGARVIPKQVQVILLEICSRVWWTSRQTIITQRSASTLRGRYCAPTSISPVDGLRWLP